MEYPYEHWEYDRRGGGGYRPSPPAPHARHYHPDFRHSGHLGTPEPPYSNLYRSHSQGYNIPNHPTTIHITNRIPIKQETISDQRPPAPMPPIPQFQHAPPQPVFVQPVPILHQVPPPPHAIPDTHALHAQRLGERIIADNLASLHLHQRHRSHSCGRSPHDQHNQEEAIANARLRWDLDQERRAAAAADAHHRAATQTAALKRQFELEAEKNATLARQASVDAAAERKRVIEDYERQRAETAQQQKDLETSIIQKLEMQARQEAEKEKRAQEEFLRKQREKEEERARVYKEALRLQEEQKQKKEKEYQDFLREQKDKKEKADEEEKKQKAKIDSAMRGNLEKLGWSQNVIEEALDPEKALKDAEDRERSKRKNRKNRRNSCSPGGHHIDGEIIMVPPDHGMGSCPPPVVLGASSHRPVYPRVHRKYLDIETLDRFHVPWEWDPVSFSFITFALCFFSAVFLVSITNDGGSNKQHSQAAITFSSSVKWTSTRQTFCLETPNNVAPSEKEEDC
jgi:chemotaxis protein histidine kinase CheA